MHGVIHMKALENTIKAGLIITISLVILLMIGKILKSSNRELGKIDDSEYLFKGCLKLGINIENPENNKEVPVVSKEAVDKLLNIFTLYYRDFGFDSENTQSIIKYCGYKYEENDNQKYLTSLYVSTDKEGCEIINCKDGECINVVNCECANKTLYICKKIQEYYIKNGVLNPNLIEKAIGEVK